MTAKTLEQEAADKIEELWEKLKAAYDEIARTYEIVAVLHEVSKGYLAQVKLDKLKPEELAAVNVVRDAVRAIEENLTLEQARLAREEEETE